MHLRPVRDVLDDPQTTNALGYREFTDQVSIFHYSPSLGQEALAIANWSSAASSPAHMARQFSCVVLRPLIFAAQTPICVSRSPAISVASEILSCLSNLTLTLPQTGRSLSLTLSL